MTNNISIAPDIYLIGVNDRRTQLFENIWPLPAGVSYNCYLIADEKTVLLDTVQSGSEVAFIERVEAHLGGRPLDFLVVNHMEPDHTGELQEVRMRWPNVKVLGNSQTRKIMENYYGDVSGYFTEIADGDTLPLGKHTLSFHHTPWVHWPETMMTFERENGILFSGDAFGTFGCVDGEAMDGGALGLNGYEEDMRRYYSNIVGKYGNMVQKALGKLSSLPVKTICPVHGPVWRKYMKEVVSLYDKWSRGEADDAVMIVYASMYGNTARVAGHIASELAAEGVRDVRVYDVSKTHLSYLISEMWRCRYIIFGSCSYNANMFPLMELLCTTVKNYGSNLKGREFAFFGTGSWSGGAVRTLKAFAAESGWNLICEPVEAFGLATPDKLAQFEPLAEAVTERIKEGEKTHSTEYQKNA